MTTYSKVIDSFVSRREAQLALELARRYACGGDAELRRDCRGDWWLTNLTETLPTPLGLHRERTCCPATLDDVKHFIEREGSL